FQAPVAMGQAMSQGLASNVRSSQSGGAMDSPRSPAPSQLRASTPKPDANKPLSGFSSDIDQSFPRNIKPVVMREPKYRSNDPLLKVDLNQAVQLAILRNLRMADSRLAVQEKEYIRREAFSDFFPTIDLGFRAAFDRYQNSGFSTALNNTHPGKYIPRAVQLEQSVAYLKQNDPDSTSNPRPYRDRTYRIDPYRQFSSSITLTQPIFSGGKLINEYKYARLGVDYTAIQAEVNRQNLILDVNDAYYSLMLAMKLLQVANESVRALEALRNQTMEFYKAGVVPKVDVLSTEGQLAQARIQRTQALTDIQKQTAQLNYLLRNPQETPTKIVEDLSYQPSDYDIPAIYAIAAANRLEIRQANISVDQALALIKVAKGDLLPNISAKATGTRLNDDWNTLDPEGTNSWQLQGVLTWTFDFFRKRMSVQERRVSEARSFVAREQLVEQIMNDVKQAYMDMKRSESDIFDNRKAVEFRRENFRINQERYKEQVATYVEVLDAQRQLSLSEGDYYTSLIGYKLNRATLERQMGILR
ncbi:MAG: TolC family protein, partial [Desulfomonilaceae bacterium]